MASNAIKKARPDPPEANAASGLNHQDFSEDDEAHEDVIEVSSTSSKGEEIASLALDISVKFLPVPKYKREGQGRAGAPLKKSSSVRRCIDFGPTISFRDFKKSVCETLQRIDKKHSIGKVEFDALDLEVKIPKGPAKWKQPLAITTEDTFKILRSVIFKAKEKYAESVAVLNEVETDDDAKDPSSTASGSDVQLATHADRKRAAASSSSTVAKKKGKASNSSALPSVFSPHKETLKKIEQTYACDRASCNPGGQCLIHENRHIVLTKRKKKRFVATVVDTETHTVDNPPSFLFENDPPLRGMQGSTSKRHDPRTPTRSSTLTEDLTITISSSSRSTPQVVNSRRRRTLSSFSSSGPADEDYELKETVAIPEFDPLTPGPVLLIEDAARLLHIGEDTVTALKEAGFVRVGQLARSYKNNFRRLVKEAKLTTSKLTTSKLTTSKLTTSKLTTSKLSDIEELLLHWLSIQRDPLGGNAFNLGDDAHAGFGMFGDPFGLYAPADHWDQLPHQVPPYSAASGPPAPNDAAHPPSGARPDQST